MMEVLFSHRAVYFLAFLAMSTADTATRRELIEQKVIAAPENALEVREAMLTTRKDALLGNLKELEICECESASGGPNGLSCEREGWFISNYEQAGQWANGGGWVPLSRAVCCRPCFPDEIPGSSGTDAVAIISTGCHPTSNTGPSSLKCEASGGSMITGWSQALRIPDARQYYYPVGAVQCCTPTLLLSNGDARPLERCNCVEEPNVNCGAKDSGRFLTGYARWGGDRSLGVPPIGDLVPIAPSLCCKACISDTVIPSGSCFDLNSCSGHGSCNLGTCDCVSGYGGADCSHRVQMDPGGLSQFAIAMIVLSSVATALLLLIIVMRVGQYCAEDQIGEEQEGSENEADLTEPLLPGLASDDEGSVGSEDSSNCDEDDHMPPPLSRRHPPAEEAVGGGVPVTPEEQALGNRPTTEQEAIMQQESAPRPDPTPPTQNVSDSTESQVAPAYPTADPESEDRHEEGNNADVEQDDEIQGQNDEEALIEAQVQADQVVISGIRQAQNHAASDESQDNEKKAKEEKDRGGLPGIFCTICMSRPIQVAVVPCGHMCMCRRCSRRLLTCPVCRVKILRRQKIYLGG